MTLILTSSVTAMAAGLSTYFLGVGGTAPYTYAVLPNGAGGTINASTGQYTAPAIISENPVYAYDTIKVTDNVSATATEQILIGTPLILVCDILQSQLGLDNKHIYLWDQKILQPTDSDLYLAIGVVSSKIFGSSNNYKSGSGLNALQSVNVMDTLSIDAISRGPAARDQRANIIMAFNSTYSESQQELNSFYLAPLPSNGTYLNLSQQDGSAIPYRFRITVNMQYFQTNLQPIPYFSNFQTPQVTVNQ